MKKVIEDLNVFRKYFRIRQEVSDKIQTSISFVKDELQISIEIIYLVRKERKNILVEWGWTKTIAYYEYNGKTDHRNEHNIREYDISG